jgi:hypothetical protein
VITAVLIIFMVCLISLLPSNKLATAATIEADPTIVENYLGFDIDTSTYVSGTIVRADVLSALNFTINLKGSTKNPVDTELWYYAKETLGVPQPNDGDWLRINGSFSSIQDGAYLSTPATTFVDLSAMVSNQYIYFKTIYNTGTDSYFYINPRFINLIVDNNYNPSDNAIEIVNAEFLNSEATWTPYDTATTPWIATRIRLTATMKQTANGTVYYSLDNSLNWIPMELDETQTSAVKYVSYLDEITLVEEPFSGAYVGGISFKANDATGLNSYPYGALINVRIDTRTPSMEIDPRKIVSGSAEQPVYIPGEWSAHEVLYTVRSAMLDSIYGADATFYYTIDIPTRNNWIPMTVVDSKTAVFTARETYPTLYFKAVSAAGKEHWDLGSSYPTFIDKEIPALTLTALDAEGILIKTMGSPKGTDYKSGYASDKITFTAVNSAPNSSTVTFSYADITDNPDQTTDINFIDPENNLPGTLFSYVREFTYNPTLITRTFAFRAKSLANLEQIVKFTVAILPSNFSFEFAEPIDYDKINGWGNKAITVKLKVAAVFGISSEFVFSYRPAGTTVSRPLNAQLLSYYDGYSIFETEIDVSINKQILAFTAENLANNKNLTPLLTSEQIMLDLDTPQATITRFLTDSSIEIDDNGWANGRVVIRIVPKISISGLTCESILENLPARKLDLVNGSYTREVTISGAYRFRLTTGSGLTTDYVVNVNIDNTVIILNNVSAYTEVIAGDVYTEEQLTLKKDAYIYQVEKSVSHDVSLTFDSNHSGHFSVYYQVFSGANPVDGAYLLAQSDKLKIAISSLSIGSSTGTVKYAFYIESKAVSVANIRYRTETNIIIVNYDIRAFDISVITSAQSDYWQDLDVSFYLRSLVPIIEYQYRAESYDGTYTNWLAIEGDITADDNGYHVQNFIFSGFENFYENRSIGFGFRGTIYFRGISYANAVSNVLAGIVVRLDKTDGTNPNPLNVIKTSGALRQESNVGSTEYWRVYSVDKASDLSVPTALVFKNIAPIRYYYFEGENDGIIPAKDEFVDEITTTRSLPGGVGYLLATNESGTKNNIIKIISQKEETASNTPRAIMYPAGAAKNSNNIYEYNWTSSATVNLSISNIMPSSGVYYYFSTNGIDWTLMNKNQPLIASNGSSTLTIEFSGIDGTSEFVPNDSSTGTYTYFKNFDAVVQFRVVTLGGLLASFESKEDRVRIKIDVLQPTFNIQVLQNDVVVATADSISPDNLATDFLPAEPFIRIVPTDPTNVDDAGRYNEANDKVINPSGVIYTFRFSASESWQNLPGTGKNFSLDQLTVDKTSGIFTLFIRARIRGGSQEYSRQISIRVDRIVPEFTIRGTVTPDGASISETILTGEWTRAREVVLAVQPRQPVQSGLSVNYFYYESTNSGNLNIFPSTLRINETSKIHIIARNSAGIEVEHLFDVNIDYTPPVINAGIIENNSVFVDGKEVINYDAPFKYYIDQVITYTENNIKTAYYNGFPLINGATIGTNTVDNSNGGLVHIVVEDLAGNKAELVFYMTVFELRVNTITLSPEHRVLLQTFKDQFDAAVDSGTLTDAPRRAYFNSQIISLQDRLQTLQKEVDAYQLYLTRIADTTQFTLANDYNTMHSYINLFISKDETVRYPEWQQNLIRSGVFVAAYAKLETEYNKLRVLMEKVESLQGDITSLPAVNVVSRDDYQGILRSYNEYTNLATTQKGVFNTSLYTKLLELKRRCELLLLQDDATGVKIEGEHLSAGVSLEIQNYDNSSELVANAQKTLLQVMPSTDARAIIYVKKLMLSSLGAQYNTGLINITLSIPTEYKEYISFGVYRLASDGTIVPIKNFIIDAFGTSLTFSSESLDTYILAAKAEVSTAPVDENIMSIFNIPIDYTMMTYIAYVAAGLFGMAIIVLVIVGIRQRRFLKKYNRNYKRSLVSRGISAIPKGNTRPRTNPLDPTKPVNYN